MPLRNVATTFTIEQQRLEINALAGDVNNIATGVTNVGTAATANALAAGATGVDLTLSGTLTVNGTQTILNTETLQVEDKEIVIGNVSSPTDATAHGGGWKLKGANNKTITYNQTGDKWESNKNFEAPNLAYTSGDQTFSGNLTIQKGSTDSADLMIGATGTGEARIYLDASNGDFGGADYAYIKQSDGAGGSGASLRIGNMNDGGIQFLVGEGFGGAGNALSIINNGNVGIGNNNPNWPLTVQRSSGTTVVGCKNTGGNATVYVEASDGNTAKLELVEAGTGSYSLQVGNDNALMFFDDSTERLRIDSGGNATFTQNINLAEGKKTIFNSNSGTGAYIKHQSGHLEIKNETGNLYWDNIGSVRLRTGASYTTALEIIGQNATFGGTVSDSIGDLRSIPANNQPSAYSLAGSDAGKCVLAGGQISIPNDVGFVEGDAVTIINNSGSAINFAHNSVTLYNTADGTTLTSPNGELGARGMCTIYFVSNTVAYISGSQIS